MHRREKLKIGPVGSRFTINAADSRSGDHAISPASAGAGHDLARYSIVAAKAPDGLVLQLSANATRLPDDLKTGIETLSGLSMDDVHVHRHSMEPGRLGALAFAKGTEIHLAPGQDRHLPHEAWHVVQQKQGRVRATARSADGRLVNDDAALEGEADQMGRKALENSSTLLQLKDAAPNQPVIQRYWMRMDGEVMWANGEPDAMMKLSEDRHDAEDAHPAGNIYDLAADDGEHLSEPAAEARVLDEDPVWEHRGTLISVKHAGEEQPPALEGPRGAWNVGSFFDLGLEDDLTDAQVEHPIAGATHYNFWCKLAGVDVKIHLTEARYSVIYHATGRPALHPSPVLKEGLRGRDLYHVFLEIAERSGDYNSMRNDCQVFANNMLNALKASAGAAVEDELGW